MPILKKNYISTEHGLAYKCEEIVSGDEFFILGREA
jgi:hypothetical protein